MKALIRNQGETVTQDMGLTFIDWNTGAPLTNPAWYGGPYTLVDDYVPPDPVEGHEEPVEDTKSTYPVQSTPVEEKPSEQSSEPLPDTVTYGGKEYTLEELKKLIG